MKYLIILLVLTIGCSSVESRVIHKYKKGDYVRIKGSTNKYRVIFPWHSYPEYKPTYSLQYEISTGEIKHITVLEEDIDE